LDSKRHMAKKSSQDMVTESVWQNIQNSLKVKSIDVKEMEGREFELGGPDVLTYVDMMKRYAKMINKSVRILILPFLTPRLSSYWAPVKASLARPLIDSLKHEARVKDDSIKHLIPIQLKNFEESIKAAKEVQVF
jgi:uncharacterized protein YbjT (DUF2867 family)